MGARFDINFVKNTKGRKSNWMDFLTSSGLLQLGGDGTFFGGAMLL